MALLELAQIRMDGGTQPRAYGTEFHKVDEYSELMRDGVVFPPVSVTFDGTSYWLVDGFHRVEAAKKAELASIECEITAGTLEDAQWKSYGVNATHGLPRTNMDKRRAVKAALSHAKGHELSDRAIAEHVGCDHKTVGAVRRELEGAGEVPQATYRTGRDGQVRSIGDAGRPDAPAVSAAPEVPEGGWPQPDDNRVYDDSQAELLVESFGRGQRQASINLLQVGGNAWAIGWSVSLSEKGGVGVTEPLLVRLRRHDRDEAVEWGAKEIIQWCRRNREGRPKSQLDALEHFVDWAMRLANVTEDDIRDWDTEENRRRRRRIIDAAESLITPLAECPSTESELDLPAGVDLRDVVKIILSSNDDDFGDWIVEDVEEMMRKLPPLITLLQRLSALIAEEKVCAA